MASYDDQAGFWNDEAGPRWVRAEARLDRMLAPITARLMEAADAAEGERAVDIGCGCGETTLALADRVGATGSVLGIDISAPMLKRARARNRASHVQLERADAATYQFDAKSADLVLSRLGVMFFADSTAAFSNIRAAMRDDGRCVFACWQSLDENPWLSFPLEAAGDLVPPPPPRPEGAPGPFRFADRERTTRMLHDAGFGAVAIEPLETNVPISGSVDEILEFFLEFGPASRAFVELERADHDEAVARVRAALTDHHDGQGVTWPAASLIVRATG